MIFGLDCCCSTLTLFSYNQLKLSGKFDGFNLLLDPPLTICILGSFLDICTQHATWPCRALIRKNSVFSKGLVQQALGNLQPADSLPNGWHGKYYGRAIHCTRQLHWRLSCLWALQAITGAIEHWVWRMRCGILLGFADFKTWWMLCQFCTMSNCLPHHELITAAELGRLSAECMPWNEQFDLAWRSSLSCFTAWSRVNTRKTDRSTAHIEGMPAWSQGK